MEPTATATAPALRNDPITFEVLRNGFRRSATRPAR